MPDIQTFFCIDTTVFMLLDGCRTQIWPRLCKQDRVWCNEWLTRCQHPAWTSSQRRLDVVNADEWVTAETSRDAPMMARIRDATSQCESECAIIKHHSERKEKTASSTDRQCLFMTQQPVCPQRLAEIPIQTAGGVRVWFVRRGEWWQSEQIHCR